MKNMKLFILTLMILPTSVFSQQFSPNVTITPMECTSYIPNNEINKFLGHWKWLSGNNSFEMILKKEKVYDLMKDDQSCEDVIIGFHQYVKNGIMVESSLQNQNTSYNQKLQSIYFPGYIENNILYGGIDNISNLKNHIKIELEYIDASHIKIKVLKHYDGVRIFFPGQPIPSSEINLPQDIILTKQ